MCGINGFTNFGNIEDIRRMTHALNHRGPDDSNTYHDDANSVFLGHARLSIIDINDGSQPMQNEDIVIVYNGEIYNHQHLREALVKNGYKFTTSHSDTEVIIHGYKAWGVDLFKKLNGMFAISIYDKHRKKIIMARDRFGEKPLYYYIKDKNFAFSSELTALTQHSGIDKNINTVALKKYFAYGNIPAPLAFYKNCFKLSPGHYAEYDISSSKIIINNFFRFILSPDESLNSEQELSEELDALISNSVKNKLMSDVPLGIFLSGGLDSSAVLSYASKHMDTSDISTFTIGFHEKSFDESTFAKDTAKHFGTRHFSKTISFQDIQNSCYSILDKLDEPIGDPSILPTYFLCNFASQQIKVALSGDGGDELFAGYSTFDALSVANLYHKIIPNVIHTSNIKLANLLPISNKNMAFDFKLKRALSGLSFAQPFWNPIWLSSLLPEEISDLFNEDCRIEDLYSEVLAIWESTRHLDLIDQTMMFYTHFYLPGNVLAKVDRAAMMNSLESRAIFLDNDIGDFCMKLPNKFKYNKGNKKYLLKKVLEKKIPSAISKRKKKGFGIPLVKWLQEFPENIPYDKIPGISMNIAHKYWDEHRSGTKDRRFFLWNWLVLQRYINKSNG